MPKHLGQMIAFPEKLRGSSESILSGKVRSRIPVLEKSRQTNCCCPGRPVSPPALLAVPFGRAGKTLWVCFARFFFFFFPAKLPQHWKISPVKVDSETPPGTPSCTQQIRLHGLSCSLYQHLCPTRGFMDSQCHRTATHRQMRLPKHHFHTMPKTIPPLLKSGVLIF